MSVTARAKVTAGFAKLVEAVNQYADGDVEADVRGTLSALHRSVPRIARMRPKVATPSANQSPGSARAVVETWKIASPNMRCAAQVPKAARRSDRQT